MKIYIAHSYKHRDELESTIDTLIKTVTQNGHTAFVFTREYKDYGPEQYAQMMSDASKEMDSSDVLIAEVSTKEIGVGIEVGYFTAMKKPIIYIRREGAKFSSTVAGVSETEIEYTSEEHLVEQITHALNTVLNN